MSKRRLWMYPYNNDYLELAKYSDKISGYEIISKSDIDYKQQFEELYHRIDEFDGILMTDISRYSSLEIEYICKNCRKLIADGKLVIAVNDKFKIDGAVYLDHDNIFNNEPLEIPVVALLKTDSIIDNFNLSMNIKIILEKKDIKVLVLSTFPYANIIDDYILVPKFMYSKVSAEEKVENIKSYILNKFYDKEYDIMLLDCPVGLLDNSEHKADFLTLELLSAFLPDYVLVQILAEEYVNISVLESDIERVCTEKINSLVMSNMFFDRETYKQSGKVKYFPFSDSTVNRLVCKINRSNKPVFSCCAINEICDDILKYISYDIDDCRKVGL